MNKISRARDERSDQALLKLAKVERDDTLAPVDDEMKMILEHQPQLPVTHLNLYFTHPHLSSPTGHTVALYTLAQRQISRGTRRRTRSTFMRDLGLLGTELTLTQRRFAHSVSATVLSRKWEPLIDLIIEALTEPHDRLDELAQSKRAYQAELAARYDMDAALAWLWLMRRISIEHPWMRASVSVTAKDIERVTAEEIKRVWPEMLSATRLLPCLSSNLSHAQLQPQLETLSQALGGSTSLALPTPTPIEPLRPLSQTTLSLIHKADRQQAQVLIAQPSISPRHPDHLALSLAVCALGGTFSSPLMQEVRVKRGLSYGAHAGIRGEGEARYLTLHATPESRDAAETLNVMRSVLCRAALGELSDAEIEFAKSYLINAHPFNIETATMRATLRARSLLQGLDPHEVMMMPERLVQLSSEEVRAAARRHLTPQALEVLVFGDHESEGLARLEAELSSEWSVDKVMRADATEG